jgi:hypothetical protein
VALAHRDAVGGDDGAEQREALVLSQLADERAEPVAVLGFDRELSLPLAVDETMVLFGSCTFSISLVL